MSNSLVLSQMPPGQQAQTFSKRIHDKLMTSTLFGKLTGKVTKHLNEKYLPDSVIMMDNVDFQEGTYKTNIPWTGKLSGDYVRGDQVIEGTEESVPMRSCDAYYQREAKAVPGKNVSVDGEVEAKFYDLATRNESRIRNYFAEIDDYNVKRGLLQGYSEAITDTAGWANSNIRDVNGNLVIPSVRLHPNWFVKSVGFVNWNSTYSTYETAIDDAIDGLAATVTFGSADIITICELAHRNLTPVTDENLLNGAKYLAILTPEQNYQLMTENNSSFLNKFAAGAVDAMKNPNITGVIGVFQEVLFVVDPRSAVWKLSNSAGSKIVYSKPQTDNNTARSTSIVARTVKGSANAGTGTAELALVLGKGALVRIDAGEFSLKSKLFDMNTKESLAGVRMTGMNRPDFFPTATSTQPVVDGSFVFTTVSVGTFG